MSETASPRLRDSLPYFEMHICEPRQKQGPLRGLSTENWELQTVKYINSVTSSCVCVCYGNLFLKIAQNLISVVRVPIVAMRQYPQC